MISDTGSCNKWAWWWKVTALLVALCLCCTKTMLNHWYNWPASFIELIWWPGLILWLITSIWLFIYVPYLDSRKPNRAWTVEPVKHLLFLQAITWVPFGLTVISITMLGLVFPLVHYLDHHKWVWGGWSILPWMSGLVFFTIVFTVYAYWMSKLLTRNIIKTTTLNRICYMCGYNLYGIQSTQCPECGHTK